MEGVGGVESEQQQQQQLIRVDPDISTVDSITDHPSDEPPPQESDQLHLSVTGTPVLTDELRDKIIKQVEYYLSDENLRTDKFLLKYLTKDEEGYVPIAVIATFKRMKKLTHHKSLIVAALKESSLLALSSNEKKVKRIHPFPLTEFLDPELCTVLVENLPEDHTIENMKKIFCHAGTIKKIAIHEENAAKDTRKCSIEEKLLSGKLYASVEYETVEAAEKAVATLNNEQDWRHGMRVKLLKRRVKNTQKKKGHDSEKKHNVHVDSPGDKENQQSSEHHDDTPDDEHAPHIGEHQAMDKNGHRGQNSRRSRKPKHQGPSGMGHGTPIHNHGHEISKPPPGPRMPDGTRGFTMGRGRVAVNV
ncbi:la-related protein 6A-like [Bidens hawaiensis]|uniref:la-related protein 6A-like n=1 Tax=Bidens hawaiensis TaxID=980011 RepID=UPI00404AF76D